MIVFPPRSIRWSCLALGLLPVAAWAAADPIDQVGKAAGDWLKTRAETVRLQSEWSSQRQLLESTVKALEERAGSLEDKRDHLLAKTAKVDKSGRPVGGVFIDEECSQPADEAVTSLAGAVRYYPALEQGKAVEGVARLILPHLEL